MTDESGAESPRFVHGQDLDTDAFAETLRNIADGVDSDNVLLQSVDATSQADVNDVAKVSLTVDCIAKRGYEGVLDPVEYREADDD